jgi:ubiquinone/menaquinone biosynthesis C-methylase UbiE
LISKEDHLSPDIFSEFERILSERTTGKSILEIGAVPTRDSLLNLPALENASERIGINVDGGASYITFYNKNSEKKYSSSQEYMIIKGDANKMDCFEDNKFDTVLCNSVFEHDKYFWKTIAEIRRVAKDGALIAIGVPGYDDLAKVRFNSVIQKIRGIMAIVLKRCKLLNGTVTQPIHNWPGDYYRFSQQAVRDVIFDGLSEVVTYSIMIPPRVIGIGYNKK